jgi:hypothetical protein
MFCITSSMVQAGRDRRYEFRTHGRVLRDVQPFGHPGHGTRQDDIGLHALCRPFDRDDIVQSDDAGLGDAVVHDIVGPVEAADRPGQHDAAIARLAHDRESRPHDMKRAHQMDVDDRLEILVADLVQRAVADIAGIMDEDVDAAVMVERRLDDRPAAGRRRHGFGAGNGDRRHRPACRRPDR